MKFKIKIYISKYTIQNTYVCDIIHSRIHILDFRV